MMMHFIKNNQKGFTVLYAVLVSSLVLAIGVSIFNIAFKQLVLSSQVRESQFAFYAADSGLECALYWDFQYANSDYESSIFGGVVSVSSLANGLVGYWSLNDGVGLTAIDSSVSHNNGSLRNMEPGPLPAETDWVSGQIGSALIFDGNVGKPDDGSDEYVDIDDASGIINPIEGAVSFWVYTPASAVSDGAGHTMVDFALDGSNYITFNKNSGNVFVFRYMVGGTHSQLRITSAQEKISFGDTWKHVVLMWEDIELGSDDMFLYIDGVLSKSGPRTVTLPPDILTKAAIGANRHGGGSTNHFRGELDEIRVYNRSLTQSEITVLAGQDLFSYPIPQDHLPPNEPECVGEDISDPETGWDTDGTTDIGRDWNVTTDTDYAFTAFDLEFADGFCATVTVEKDEGVTTIESRGYNTCNENDPNRVERALRATY